MSHMQALSDTASAAPIFLPSQHLRKFFMIEATNSHDPIWRSPVAPAVLTQNRIARSAIQYALLSTVVQSPQSLVYINPVVSSAIQTFMDHMSTLIKPLSMRIVHKYETLNRMGVRIRPRISLTLIHPSEPGGVRFNVQPGDDTENEEIMRLHLRRGIAASPLFSDIRELWMDGNARQLLRPPHSILPSLPNLQYLQVLCDELDEWISQGTFEALAHAEGGGLVCPQLESLNVLVLSEQPTERAQVVFEQIRALVERRIGLGRPLKRLYLSIIVSPSRTSNPRLILETRRELGSLVEHFDLHVRKRDSGRFPNVDCWREWDDRLPLGCRSGDELVGYWPAWERDLWP
ncbi:hypothetical protein TRAPUB_258 [Trametes pubescens]|uniref:Uncharacterized protein n=1 Tax=Trametes pubescens TaxID=154538 RepID=A0A1M2VMK4_TRAPU|nr:hypothetical protein TRAPUB_258 [Trametes pubescens]